MPRPSTQPNDDAIDLRMISAALRRRWRWPVVGTLAGVLLALAVVVLVTPRYDGEATAILRKGGGGAGIGLPDGRGIQDLLSLPGLPGADFDTELEILRSRSLVQRAVDSLHLQVRVAEPAEVAPQALFSSVRVPASTEKTKIEFRRVEGGFEIDGGDGATTIPDGGTWSGGETRLTIRAGAPDRFRIEIRSMEETLRQIRKRLDVEEVSGRMAEVTFRHPSPEVAAELSNLLVHMYLDEARERERRVRRERIRLAAMLGDSVRTELSDAVDRLREHHERTGTFRPERVAELERVAEIRAEGDLLQVEIDALDQVLTGDRDSLTVAELAALPSFLQNPGINELLHRILELHTERAELLQRRTARSPSVQALTENIRFLEGELLSLARSYRENVARTLASVGGELERQGQSLAGRPGEEAAALALEGEVERLATEYVGIQGQVVQERLEAIQDDGARQVDVAFPPEEPAFPPPALTLLIGLAAGLFAGSLGLAVSSALDRKVRSPAELSRVLGLPAFRFHPERALLLPDGDHRRRVLVLPVSAGVPSAPVARSIADTAVLRGRDAAVLDLTGEGGPRFLALPSGVAAIGKDEEYGEGGDAVKHGSNLPAVGDGGGGGLSLRERVSEIAERFHLIAVALHSPHEPSTVALAERGYQVVMVAREGFSELDDVEETVAALRSLDLPILGLVLLPEDG